MPQGRFSRSQRPTHRVRAYNHSGSSPPLSLRRPLHHLPHLRFRPTPAAASHACLAVSYASASPSIEFLTDKVGGPSEIPALAEDGSEPGAVPYFKKFVCEIDKLGPHFVKLSPSIRLGPTIDVRVASSLSLPVRPFGAVRHRLSTR
ncbi:hypothetical protein GY45DRAFT_1331789 [Cubamyces sp. BRFM 1775]|nr:hypothetical protein GY45DRAFT_1331789 [Cubamyces sp. BRFM 1775]